MRLVWKLLIAILLFYCGVVYPLDQLLTSGVSTGNKDPWYDSRFTILKCQALSAGQLSTIKYYSGAGNIKVAVYADNSGSPGSLLSGNNSNQAASSGWNNAIITGINVNSGDYYWVGFNFDSTYAPYYDGDSSGNGTAKYKTSSYGSFSFPNPAGSFTFSWNYPFYVEGYGVSDVNRSDAILLLASD